MVFITAVKWVIKLKRRVCSNLTACQKEIQAHKSLKTALFIMTKHHMQMFGVRPFLKLQNNT